MNFRAPHPLVRVRVMELNSRQSPTPFGRATSKPARRLPIDDRGLDVGPVEWTAEAVYLSRRPVRRPVSVHELAAADLILPEVRWGDLDPTRRQLLAMAQNAGVAVHPVVGVSHPPSPWPGRTRCRGHRDLVAAGARAAVDAHAELELPRSALYETFAFITRRDANLSPATEVLVRLARQRLARSAGSRSTRRPERPVAQAKSTPWASGSSSE